MPLFVWIVFAALCAVSYVIIALRAVTGADGKPPRNGLVNSLPDQAIRQKRKKRLMVISPRPVGYPTWSTVLIIVLLIFAIAAHVLGVATEVVVLLITTVTGAVMQLAKPQSEPRKATPDAAA
ncbi:hypothetical protein [Nonomuraea dietziae]|uniref:hypothetical protein n=1 Tax=Nonomuraea dietziae TaxID=65515 RepID=UPI0033E6C861